MPPRGGELRAEARHDARSRTVLTVRQVGHGGSGSATAPRGVRSAIRGRHYIAAGYGDGVPRSSSQTGTPVLIQEAPRATRRPRLDGHDRGGRSTGIPAVGMAPRRCLWGQDLAGRGDRPARGDIACLRTRVQRQPARAARAALKRFQRGDQVAARHRFAPPPLDQLTKKPILTPASWMTSLSFSLVALAPIGVPFSSGKSSALPLSACC